MERRRYSFTLTRLLVLFAAIAAAGALYVGFVRRYKGTEWEVRAARFEACNPSADARAALARGDKRFIAKYGVGLSVPSLRKDSWMIDLLSEFILTR